jgi:hypothetical protein
MELLSHGPSYRAHPQFYRSGVCCDAQIFSCHTRGLGRASDAGRRGIDVLGDRVMFAGKSAVGPIALTRVSVKNLSCLISFVKVQPKSPGHFLRSGRPGRRDG